jgi:RimJ/RimL family protein N-acetyltransferase
MEYKEQKHQLKDGRICIFRSPVPADAETVLNQLKIIHDETAYLSRGSNEINITVEEEEQFIISILNNPRCLMVGAFIDNQLVGSASLMPVMERERYAHRGGFGISILKEYWGLGIGSILSNIIIDNASSMGFEQIELEVVSDNKRAIHLYEKLGFHIYGTRYHGVKYSDGSYVSEQLMILYL